MTNPSIEVEVSKVEDVAERIKRFRLTPLAGQTLPAWSPGAHILVTLTNGTSTWRNAYSLMGSPHDSDAYQISVLHTAHSRGGSAYLHNAVQPGMRLRITPPANLFSLASLGRKHIFVAGGIGITPFLPMMEALDTRNVPFELHYLFRDRDRGAYVEQVTQTYGARVHLYETTKTVRPTMLSVLDHQPLGTHLYVCGPAQMIEDLLAAGRTAGWPPTHLHSERFVAGSAGRPFTLSLASKPQVIAVNEHQSILEALESAGVDAPFLCRGGSCGQCETSVLACNTELVHNDHYLSTEERHLGAKIMICVSRCQGGHLVLDL